MAAKRETIETLKFRIIHFQAEREADYRIIDGKLDQIIGHLKETNGTIADHEKRLLEQEVNKVANCPFKDDIKGLVLDEETSKKVRRAVRKWIVVASIILGAIVSVLIIFDWFIEHTLKTIPQ